MPALTLASEAQYLKGAGPRNASLFAKLGLNTVGDVLFYLPRRYEDRRNLPPIGNLRAGDVATVKGRLVSFSARPTRTGKTLMNAVLRDGSGSISLVWFNQPWIRRRLEAYEGLVIAYGPVRAGSRGLDMMVQEWEILDEDSEPDDFARLMPVYGLTEGLYQGGMRRAVADALRQCLDSVEDGLPPQILGRHGLLGLRKALESVHRPGELIDSAEGRRRIVFDEFFYLQLALAMNRADTAHELGIPFPISSLLEGKKPEALTVREPGPSSYGRPRAVAAVEGPAGTLFQESEAEEHHSVPLWDQIHAILPFELTSAQRRVIGEIWKDMERPHPMNRLVQGDVGSGKTAVAACAMLAAVRCGYQAALMAPTEILAEQHDANLRRIFQPLGIDVTLHVGKLKSRERARARQHTASGAAGIIVGTHALIEEGIEFRNLGLVVVDEQHRFGVLQRAALRDKAAGIPDVLVMTATPIPRTLLMTEFGELDSSIIDELPPGRRPIKTHSRTLHDRDAVYAAVRKLLQEGRQAYFVCPLVSESEAMLAQAAEELYERLRTTTFSEFSVGLLHGRMKPAEKEAVMEAFRQGSVNILVATTVIEVGVDVPNATVIVIEDAVRFGLAQLHQLRGRVGRGSEQSYCILIGDATSEEARARLEIMTRTTDGFAIAEEDLRLRGPGEVIGTRQSGRAEFRYGNLVQDGILMQQARETAIAVVDKDPELSGAEWRGALDRVKERRTKLATVTIS
ncbi:MAG TPA: ATP-dependent DNA helicase RecG [Fimbriimonadaceae bacterium]|nr:ATP-dependent DNA helicase RecG [Fimbriimonadaceae bacterium]